MVSIRTFEAVTGPKADDWLVGTLGLLIAIVGGVLLLAAGRGELPPEIAAPAVGSAAGLWAIDVWYVFRRVIGPIYLLDVAVEAGLIVLWAAAWTYGM